MNCPPGITALGCIRHLRTADAGAAVAERMLSDHRNHVRMHDGIRLRGTDLQSGVIDIDCPVIGGTGLWS